ncbi:hypothetical protein Angca_010269, partial [Angiostrongylus cantonensis]
ITVLLVVIAVGTNCKGSDRIKRQVLKDNFGLNTTWRGAIPYAFNTTDPIVLKMFKMGVEVWTEVTCIDFVENKAAKDKVVVVKEDDCSSSVGRVGGDQPLSLNERSTEGAAVHEIGHALGLFHTMQRFDRDNYIKLLVQNIDPAEMEEFRKLGLGIADVHNLTYDYGSVMHYDQTGCSINQQPTIMATDSRYQKTMGSGIISYSDIFMINEHYQCNARCNKSTSAKCSNDGYPHPRNCSICICPGGYGGVLCDRRPPGCGDDLVATKVEKLIAISFGLGIGLRDQFMFCHYMITAPQGKKVEVHVQSISGGYDEPGCYKGGVEIKSQKDQRLTGVRFCSKRGTGVPVVASSNRLPVIFFNRLGTMEATLKYRYI